MFDYLDTRALSEPTEIDMSDVDETEEVEITTEENLFLRLRNRRNF